LPEPPEVSAAGPEPPPPHAVRTSDTAALSNSERAMRKEVIFEEVIGGISIRVEVFTHCMRRIPATGIKEAGKSRAF
jgi:hypothetical protein